LEEHIFQRLRIFVAVLRKHGGPLKRRFFGSLKEPLVEEPPVEFAK
jgi:hypothetical protein